MAGETFVYPPGFRFHPTDEELVGYYLRRKIANEAIEGDIIPEVDLYKIEPWDLPESAVLPSSDRYFFSPRDRKYPNGGRTNRATLKGYWKATGKDRSILSGSHGKQLGMKKTLVFYLGRAPSGARTDWVMHEYRLEDGSPQSKLGQESYVLCRIFNKKGDYKDAGPAVAPSNKTLTEEDATSSQLMPPLLDAGDEQLVAGEGCEGGDLGEWDLLAQFEGRHPAHSSAGLAIAKQESVSDALQDEFRTPGKSTGEGLDEDEIEQAFLEELSPSGREMFHTPMGPEADDEMEAQSREDPLHGDFGQQGREQEFDWAKWEGTPGECDQEFSVDDMDGLGLSLEEVQGLLEGRDETAHLTGDPGTMRPAGNAALMEEMPQQHNGEGFFEVDSWFDANPSGHHMSIPGASGPTHMMTHGALDGDLFGVNTEQQEVPNLVQRAAAQRGQVAGFGASGMTGKPLIGTAVRHNLQEASQEASQVKVKQEHPTAGGLGPSGHATGLRAFLNSRSRASSGAENIEPLPGSSIQIRPRANGGLPAGPRAGSLDAATLGPRRIRMAVRPLPNGSAPSSAPNLTDMGAVKTRGLPKAVARHNGVPDVTPRPVSDLVQRLKQAAGVNPRDLKKKPVPPRGPGQRTELQSLLRMLANRVQMQGGKQEIEEDEQEEEDDVQEITQAELEASIAAKAAAYLEDRPDDSAQEEVAHHYWPSAFGGNDGPRAMAALIGGGPGHLAHGCQDPGCGAAELLDSCGIGEMSSRDDSQAFFEEALEAAQAWERKVGSGAICREEDEAMGANARRLPHAEGTETYAMLREASPCCGGQAAGPEGGTGTRRQSRGVLDHSRQERKAADGDEEDEDSSMTCARVRLVPGSARSKTGASASARQAESGPRSAVTEATAASKEAIESRDHGALPLSRRPMARPQSGAQALPGALQGLVRFLGPVLPANAAELRCRGQGSPQDEQLQHLRGFASAPALLRNLKEKAPGDAGEKREAQRRSERTGSGKKGQVDDTPMRDEAVSRGSMGSQVARRRSSRGSGARASIASAVEGDWSSPDDFRQRAFVRRPRPRQGGICMWLGIFGAVLSLCVGVVSLAKLAAMTLSQR